MKAILVTSNFGDRQQKLLGPFTDTEVEHKKRSLEGQKIVASMDFPKPVCMNTYAIVDLTSSQ